MSQLTQVTGTIKDPNGLPYADGLITPILVTPGTPFFLSSGAPYIPPSQPSGLDVNGHFIVTLADVNQLTPPGITWTFHVCSGAGTVEPALGVGPVCFDVTGVVVTGPSLDISAQLSAAAKPLTVPGFGGGGGWTALAGSHQLYVDGSRTDTYTPTGSVNFPFKTIAAATAQVVTNGDNSVSNPYAVMIAPGTYAEIIDVSNPAIVAIAYASSARADRDQTGPVFLGGPTPGVTTGSNPNLVALALVGININTSNTQNYVGNTNLTVSIVGGYHSDGNVTINGGLTVDVFGASIWWSTLNISNNSVLNTFYTQARGSGGPTLASGAVIQIEMGSTWGWSLTVPSGCSFTAVGAGRGTASITVAGGGTGTFRNCYFQGTLTVQAGGSVTMVDASFATISNSGTINLQQTAGTGALMLQLAAPTVGAGQVGYGGTTAATASAGAGAAPPATVDGYIIVNVAGVTKKIPFYAN